MEIEPLQKGQARSAVAARTPKKAMPLSKYNLFVKDNSRRVREELQHRAVQSGSLHSVTQADVMKECARLWKETKREGR